MKIVIISLLSSCIISLNASSVSSSPTPDRQKASIELATSSILVAHAPQTQSPKFLVQATLFNQKYSYGVYIHDSIDNKDKAAYMQRARNLIPKIWKAAKAIPSSKILYFEPKGSDHDVKQICFDPFPEKPEHICYPIE